MTLGTMPSFTSVNPNIASSAATTMSQTAARPAPPPSAAPCTRPISGTGEPVERVEHRRHPLRVRRFSSRVASTRSAITARSPPAQNTRPAPESTATRTSAGRRIVRAHV